MKYLKQNSSGLYLQIQKIGCFFRAALHMAELRAQKALTIDQINHLWDAAKKLHYIGDINGNKDCVITSAAIANLGLKALNFPGRFVEVAVFKAGTMHWYVPKDQQQCQYFIQKIAQGGPSKTHFKNVKADGVLEWDPHDPEILATGVYYTICYRYDEVKK